MRRLCAIAGVLLSVGASVFAFEDISGTYECVAVFQQGEFSKPSESAILIKDMVIRRLEYGFGITFTALEVGTEVKEKEVITNVIFSDGDRYLINFDWHQRNYGLIEPFPLEGYLAFGFSRGPFLPNIGYEKTEIVFVMRKIR